MNQPPRRSADSPVFQIADFRPPRRFQQTTLKSNGSLSPLSPLWFDSCPRSGDLTTEDTEKEGFQPVNPHRSESGFSLIEVMVAVVILTVAVTGLAQGITSALRASKESEWQTTAAWLASGQVELLRAEETFPAGVTEGDGAGGLKNFHWKQTITTTSISGLRDVTVEVSHKSTSKPLYELRTLLFEVPSDSLTNRPSERLEKSRKGKNRGRRS